MPRQKLEHNSVADQVKTLNLLIQKFRAAGLTQKAQAAAKLLQNTDTRKDMGDNLDAKKIWADEITKLAEELRQSSNYLESGRLLL